MPKSQRNGESPANHFRSERVFNANGAWYLATREGIDVGPYPTRAAAEMVITKLAELLRDVTDRALAVRLIEGLQPLRREAVWEQRWMR